MNFMNNAPATEMSLGRFRFDWYFKTDQITRFRWARFSIVESGGERRT
jgi:hypothetical protein